MPAQIARLCEVLIANVTLIRSLIRMLAEMIAQIATLAKDCQAASILATIVLLRVLAIVAVDLDNFGPLRRNALEILDQRWAVRLRRLFICFI